MMEAQNQRMHDERRSQVGMNWLVSRRRRVILNVHALDCLKQVPKLAFIRVD